MFRKVSGIENFMPKRAISRFSIENLSHSSEELPTFLFFTKFLVSKNFVKYREYHDFLSKLCFAVPKNFVEETFCLSEKIWCRNILWIREGRVLRFAVKNVLCQSTEPFRKGTLLCFRKFGVSKTFGSHRGISWVSIGNLLSHSTEPLRSGSLQCVTNFGFREILRLRRSCPNFAIFFVSQYRKIS